MKDLKHFLYLALRIEYHHAPEKKTAGLLKIPHQRNTLTSSLQANSKHYPLTSPSLTPKIQITQDPEKSSLVTKSPSQQSQPRKHGARPLP